MKMIPWSKPIPFEQQEIQLNVPQTPGVYRIIQTYQYSRFRGSTPILKIGSSRTDLRQEILNHFQRHTAANRLARIRGQQDVTVQVQYAESTASEAVDLERTELRIFEDSHWELPVLNSQRGYARGEDSHYLAPP